jgi:DNA-binding NarL/FixJ family response regulator
MTQGMRIRLGVVICRIAARPQQLLQKADNDADEDPTLPCSSKRGQAKNAPLKLTAKKQAIADLLARGYRQEKIAKLRGISFHTAHNHVRELYRAFKVKSLPEFLAKYHALKAAERDKNA